MKDVSTLVQVLNEFGYAAAIVELVRAFRLFTFVVNRDANSFVEKSLFSQTLRELVKTEFDRVKNLSVRFEGDLRPALPRLASWCEMGDGDPAFVYLLVCQAVTPDFQVQRLRKKVDDRNANAVQSAGNLVSVGVELAASVKFGHYDFGSGLLFLLHHIDGNAAAVVHYRNGMIKMNSYFNGVAESRQSLVNRVIDDFVNQMMQAQLACGSDIHRRSFAHSVAPFQYRNRRGIVSVHFLLQLW